MTTVSRKLGEGVVGPGEAALDQREGGGQIAVRRVCVRERLDRGGLDRCVLVCERLEGLEELDRLTDLSRANVSCASPQQCTAPRTVRGWCSALSLRNASPAAAASPRRWASWASASASSAADTPSLSPVAR